MSRNESEAVVLPPACEDVVRALWAYLDGEVEEERLEGLEAHLERCSYCQAHADFERRLVEELAGLRGSHPDPARLRSRILATLRAAGLE